jgi:hypothetical protein
LISQRKGFLFVHVPKTGGNSIQSRLAAYSDDRLVVAGPHQDGVERFEIRSDQYAITKHSTLRDYQRQLEPSLFDRLFKFAVVRNPWDRLISFYFSPHRGSVEWDRQAFVRFLSEVPPVRSYVMSNSWFERVTSSARIGPARRWVGPLDRDLDTLLRFETLERDYRMVCERLQIPYEPLPRRNASDHQAYTRYFDEELVRIVGERYRDEVEYGDYEFGRFA